MFCFGSKHDKCKLKIPWVCFLLLPESRPQKWTIFKFADFSTCQNFLNSLLDTRCGVLTPGSVAFILKTCIEKHGQTQLCDKTFYNLNTLAPSIGTPVPCRLAERDQNKRREERRMKEVYIERKTEREGWRKEKGRMEKRRREKE